MSSDDHSHKPTEADHTSQTRFGPRPVPQGHHRGDDYPFQERASSRVIPSGPVSPDGRSAYPTPSLTSKIVVWGGIALGVAGVTAATVIAARKVGDMMADDTPEPTRPAQGYKPQKAHVAPRFSELDEDQQEAMRRRVRARARADEEELARLRASASRRRRKPRRNLANEMMETATSLSSGLDGVTKSLAGAFEGFRSVAAQASSIVGEFAFAADQLRSILRNTDQRDRATSGDTSDRPENHDQTGHGDASTTEEQRLHRL